MKLNGWQRLWVIGVVLWAVFIAFLAVSTFPTKAKLDAELEASVKRYSVPTTGAFSMLTGKAEGHVETQEEKEWREDKLREAYSDYANAAKEVSHDQWKIISLGAFYAVGAPVAFYLLSWLGVISFRWVKAGFTRTDQ